jgi:hypothetical protein
LLSCLQRGRPEEGKKVLGFVSLVLLAGILYEGLKPFQAPQNGVRWTPESHGVRFVGAGTIVSAGTSPPSASGRTLEIEIEPEKKRGGDAIAAFYNRGGPRLFAVVQDEYDLDLRLESSARWGSVHSSSLLLPEALVAGESALWAVAADATGTSVYKDGLLLKRSADFRISAEEFSGRLILGTMPTSNNDWVGRIRRLALFDQVLSAERLRQHFEHWKRHGTPEIEAADACAALYLFDEQKGRTIHDLCHSLGDLHIPERYMVLQPPIMDPIWRAFEWKLWFLEDVAINVIGFVPFGFFVCGWFYMSGFRKPTLSAVLAGTAVSLLIELTQTQLPTRDSSMCDLIMNAAGSILGAALYGRATELTEMTRKTLICSAGEQHRKK